MEYLMARPPSSGQPSVTTSTRLQYGVSLSMRPGANRRDHASGIERRIQVLERASMRPDANRRDHKAILAIWLSAYSTLQ